MNKAREERARVEWPTISLIVQCYTGILVSVLLLPQLSLWLAIPVLVLSIALHSSLQHEILHGHPVPQRWLSVALVWLPVGLMVPYERFRDLHLAHHHDNRLTDPYDDPESGYLDPPVWRGLNPLVKALLRFNNALVGRLLVGPLVSQVVFMAGDFRAIRAGDRVAAMIWLRHLAGVVLVLGLVVFWGSIPLWAYLVSAYFGMSVLKIRTYLEHQAHEHAGGRTVIIEDGGLLSLLFLNNNYHAVHHSHPNVAWYELPRLFAEKRDLFLARNQGYYYRSYAQVFRAYLFHAKEPVPHPLMDEDRP